ncbi:thyroglobulin-like [Micropterus dolomieu]|uniref:thyroglobulin-like n=1 Tax=Micropterus dolomieu TaxID=147949 RepID=UPI001E8E5D75|nr:thyroglobulin-like [Micropterus dolomieu]
MRIKGREAAEASSTHLLILKQLHFISTITMKSLSVSIALCTLLSLSRASPVFYTTNKTESLCESMSQQSNIAVGRFVPQCDDNGNFLPQQCWASTGYCWCVNVITGVEIPNTRTPPGSTPFTCGLCKRERKHSYNTIGGFVPKCDGNGNFLPQQCSGSTGYCWCVNVFTGVEIPNTRTPPGTPPVTCGLCQHEREHSKMIIGRFVPKCDDNENFLPQQCSGSTGYCWCVNVFTGVEIPNTRTPPGIPPVNCAVQLSGGDEERHDGDDDHSHVDEDGEKDDEEEHRGEREEEPCAEGWSRFGRRCFVFINSRKTWLEAESYCLFEDANLASIHSYEENHFIQSLTRADSFVFPETWIGGFDAIHDSHWLWSDGSKFNYQDWNKEDKEEENEHCLKMNDGYELKWEPESCNDTLPFVCAKKI